MIIIIILLIFIYIIIYSFYTSKNHPHFNAVRPIVFVNGKRPPAIAHRGAAALSRLKIKEAIYYMKRILALSLAVALALSLSAIVFAANDEYSIEFIDSNAEGYRKFSSDNNWVATPLNPVANYGNTVYYRLTGATYAGGVSSAVTYGPVTQYSAVAGTRIFADWSVGAEWVTKTELVMRRFQATGLYEYFLAVTFKSSNTATGIADVVGEVYIKDTTGSNRINRNNITGGGAGETNTLAVHVELKYAPPVAGDATATNANITDTARRFQFITNGWEDEAFEFSFSTWGEATFTVDTIGQGDLILKATNLYNSEIGAKFPNADLDFYNGNGVSFNKIGHMFTPAAEGSYIYELRNGTIYAIPGVTYDEYDEGFTFRTRTLGTYIVSDVALALGGVVVVTPVTPGGPAVVNPATGAAA